MLFRFRWMLAILLLLYMDKAVAQVAPQADFTVSGNYYFCPGDTLQFINQSVADSATTYTWFFPGAFPPVSHLKNPVVAYGSDGAYDVTLVATNQYGSDTTFRPHYIHSDPVQSLPGLEDFEASALSPDWKIEDDGNDGVVWHLAATGSYNLGHQSLAFDNLNNNVSGTRDALRTPKFDFTHALSARLRFDVAYVVYPGYSDSLAILASVDCGESYFSIYQKGGEDLATIPDNTGFFVPDSSQWRTETVDLDQLYGQDEVYFKFENIAGYGQLMYLDNIRFEALVDNTGITAQGTPEFGVSLFPNPAGAQCYFTLKDAAPGAYDLRICNLLGQTVYNEHWNISQPGQTISVQTGDLSPGLYMAEVSHLGRKEQVKLVIR